MPQYDWRCQEDKSLLTLHQDFSDNSIPDCPVCNKPMAKVFQATPAIFRGGGWGGSK
jgi:putative FmdB family regulatory protein